MAFPLLPRPIKEVMGDFFSLLYPSCCVCCEAPLMRGELEVCMGCRIKLPKTQFHACPDNPMERNFWGRVPISRAFAYLYYAKGDLVQPMLHALKYRGNQQVGRLLGQWYASELALFDPLFPSQFDALVPVPLHPSRHRRRGYNQSACFGSGLESVWGVPQLPHALRRRKATRTQTRKGRIARWSNVAEVFEVRREEAVAGKRLLLLDDVMTTGATLEACAQPLLEAGAASVSVAAIAYARNG
jgi:ComF family protein